MSKRRNRRSGQSGKRPSSRPSEAAGTDGPAPVDDLATVVETWSARAADRAQRRCVAPDDLATVLVRAFRAAASDVTAGGGKGWGPAVLAAVATEAGGASGVPADPSPATARRAADRLLKATAADRAVDEDGVPTLLWQAAAVFGAADVDVLDLHWRHGLDPDEVAQATARDPAEVGAVIEKLPRGFAAALRTRVLWADGNPADPELAATLTRHGVTSFDPRAVRVIHRHLQGSATARARSVLPVPAVELFAAIPLLDAPEATRAEVLVAVSVAAGTAAAAGAGAGVAAAAGASDRPGAGADEVVAGDEPVEPQADAGDELATEAGDELATEAGADQADAGDELATEAAPEPDEPEADDSTGGMEDAAVVAAAIVLPGDHDLDSDTDQAEAEADEEPSGHPGDEADAPTELVPLAGAGAAGAAVTAGASGSEGPRHEPVESRRDADDNGDGDGGAKSWAVVGVVAALVLVAIISFAATRGDDEADVAAGDDTTTSTEAGPTTTRASTTTTSAPDSTDTTSAPGGSTTTTAGGSSTTTAGSGPGPTFPIVTTTTAAPRTASITSFVGSPPTPVKSGYTMGEVTLTWAVSGAPDVVTVVGPNFQSSDARGGPTSICPGTVTAGKCLAAPGTYQYRIEVILNGQQVPGSPRFYYLQVQPG